MRAGRLTYVHSFVEGWWKTVAFVVMCILEYVPFSKSIRPGWKQYALAMDDRATTPCKLTCVNLLTSIVTLGQKVTRHGIDLARQHSKRAFLGIQFDMWTMKNCRSVFVMMHASFVEPTAAKLVDLLLSSAAFPIGSHTGKAIKLFMNQTFKLFGIKEDDIGSLTLDGDAKGLKACKLIKRPFRVCFIHDLARAVLYALGLAGPKGERCNDAAAAIVNAHKKFAAFCHRSVVAHDTLQQKQAELRGAGSELEVIQAKGGKWGAHYDCMLRNLRLKPSIQAALATMSTAENSETESMDEDDGEMSSFSQSDESEDKGSSSDSSDSEPRTSQTTHARASRATISASTWRATPELVSALQAAKEATLMFQNGEGFPCIHKLIPAQITLIGIHSTSPQMFSATDQLPDDFAYLPVTKWNHESDPLGTASTAKVLKSELTAPTRKYLQELSDQLEKRRFTQSKFPFDERAYLAWFMDPTGNCEQMAGTFDVFDQHDYRDLRAKYGAYYQEVEQETGWADRRDRRRERIRLAQPTSSDATKKRKVAQEGGFTAFMTAMPVGMEKVMDSHNSSPSDEESEQQILDRLKKDPRQIERAMVERSVNGETVRVLDPLRFYKNNCDVLPVHYIMAC